MRKLTCPSGTEVLGQNLRAFLDNLQSDKTRPIMEQYGIANPQPDQWYSLADLLNVLNLIMEHPDVTFNMVAIGMKIGEIVPMPPDMPDPTLEQVLSMWNGIYQYIHRQGDVGAISFEKVNDKHFKTIHTDVYPDDFSYGIVYGYGRRFLPFGTRFTVYYDEAIPPRDHDEHSRVTIIHIAW